MKKSFLELHEEMLGIGVVMLDQDGVQDCGLCSVVMNASGSKKRFQYMAHDKTFKKLRPTKADLYELGTEKKDRGFWGSDGPYWKCGDYTGLRQNIVLLCAALNGEL